MKNKNLIKQFFALLVLLFAIGDVVFASTLSFSASGGSSSVTITAPNGYEVNSCPSWLSVNPNTWYGSTTATVTCSANSGSSRSGTITFWGTSQTISVTQEGLASNLTISPSSISFGYSGGGESISVSSNVSWSASESSSWLSLSGGSGSGDGSFTISASANGSASSRSANVTVSGGGINRTVSVTQDGVPMSPTSLSFGSGGGSGNVSLNAPNGYEVNSCPSWLNVNPWTWYGSTTATVTCSENLSTSPRSGTITFGGVSGSLSVTQAAAEPYLYSASNVSVDHNANNVNINVSSNISWSASESSNWFSLSGSSGSGNGTISVSIQANNATATRTENITISGSGATWNVTVQQAPFPLSTTSLSFNSSGGSSNVNIYPQTSWEVNTKPTWLDVNPSTAYGNTTVTVTCSTNSGSSARSGAITFYGISETIEVTQEAPPSFLNVAQQQINVDYNSHSESVNVNSNISWTASESSDWLEINGGSGSGDGRFSILVSANSLTNSRSADVTVSGGGITRTITVSQDAFPLSTTNLSFSASGGSGSVTIVSDAGYEVNSCPSWLSVNPSIMSSGSVTAAVTCNSNPGPGSRNGVITFYGISESLSVTQDAPQFYLLVAPASVSADYGAGNSTINVTSNVSWTANEDLNWLNISGGAGSGDGSFTLSISENKTGSSRNGNVTVSGEGINRLVTVSQPAFPFYPDSLFFPDSGGTKYVNIINPVSWEVETCPSWLSVNPNIGPGIATVAVICQPNPETVSRTGAITFYGIAEPLYVVQEARVRWKTISYNYDNLNNITQITADSSFVFEYEYDTQSRLDKVKTITPNSPETLEADYAYNNASQVTNLQLANLQHVTYNYDPGRGWLTSITHSENQFSESLIYNDNGNISEQSITNPLVGTNYTYIFSYDNQNRLTNAASSISNFTESYSYGLDGSILSKSRAGKTMSYNYWQGNHRLRNVIVNSDTVHYAYDLKGSLYGGFGILREYNYRNQPTEMFNMDSVIYNYSYNSNGERIRKTSLSSSGNQEYYLRDYLGRELVIYNKETGEPKEAIIYGNGLIGKIEVVGSNDNRYYYLKDHLGSIRTVLNSSGTVVSAMDYYPYGELLRDYNSGLQKYQFTEKERDKESSYSYFINRTLDTDLPMWLQVDPLSGKYPGITPYNYVLNNPLKYIDPKGLDVTDGYSDEFDALYNRLAAGEGHTNRITEGNNKESKIPGFERNVLDQPTALEIINKLGDDFKNAFKQSGLTATEFLTEVTSKYSSITNSAGITSLLIPGLEEFAPILLTVSKISGGISFGSQLLNSALGGNSYSKEDIALYLTQLLSIRGLKIMQANEVSIEAVDFLFNLLNIGKDISNSLKK